MGVAQARHQALRRNTRQRLAVAGALGAHEIVGELGAQALGERDVGVGFDAPQRGIGAVVLGKRELALVAVPFFAVLTLVVFDAEARVELVLARLELLVGERAAEDEVADGVAEDRQLAAHPARAAAQRQVEAEGPLRLEVGVADLEGQVAGVRSEEVELLERRVAGRARQAGGDDEVVVGRAAAG